MKISTRGRYALRVMLDLAVNGQEGYCSLAEIAGRQGISVKYLEAIVALLNRAGYVKSLRGKKGGYRLALLPRDCTVGQVLRLTEGSLAPVACLEKGAPPCQRAEECPTLSLWRGLYERIDGYLESVTLADLLLERTGEESCPLVSSSERKEGI